MVVCSLVRIRNNTLRTYRLVPGDPFFTPSIDNDICIGDITVPPGFDQTADGLMIPWEGTTRGGFEIYDDAAKQHMRCVVGPINCEGENRDWLKFHKANWDTLRSDKWIPMGRRHILGTIGTAVEIQLTFRDAHSQVSECPEIIEVVHFEHSIRCAQHSTVFLNVFDLVSSMSIPNAILCNTTFSAIGAFHTAVEIYGEEWSFYRTPNPKSCGVCKSLHPRHHPVHVYRQSLNLGATKLKDWEVKYLVRGKLASKWSGGDYDLLYRNCIHFCEELQLSLGVKPVPAWVRGLHETGACVFSIPWPLSYLFSSAKQKMQKGVPDSTWGTQLKDDDDRLDTESVAASELSATSLGARTGDTSEDPGMAPSDGTFADMEGVSETNSAPSTPKRKFTSTWTT
mmetsp:Transcript_19027/g.53688  ORF Transcript_19027/g.53688 Transcript_19027/m.53688 type:complete len:397 (+) Transcript_19027:46-1236(+)